MTMRKNVKAGTPYADLRCCTMTAIHWTFVDGADLDVTVQTGRKCTKARTAGIGLPPPAGFGVLLGIPVPVDHRRVGNVLEPGQVTLVPA